MKTIDYINNLKLTEEIRNLSQKSSKMVETQSKNLTSFGQNLITTINNSNQSTTLFNNNGNNGGFGSYDPNMQLVTSGDLL